VGETQGFHNGTVKAVNCSEPVGMGGGRTETIGGLIQTDIKVMPGACGSPLVRKDGRVVGVVVAGNGGGRSVALSAPRLREMLG
jgi:S1-C subfamily serine protease